MARCITSHHMASRRGTSRHITSHHIALRRVASRHVTSHHIASRRVASRHITSHHITSHHITSHHITSHHITSHHITSHHITSHHITSHHITSHHITSHHITSHSRLCCSVFLIREAQLWSLICADLVVQNGQVSTNTDVGVTDGDAEYRTCISASIYHTASAPNGAMTGSLPPRSVNVTQVFHEQPRSANHVTNTYQ